MKTTTSLLLAALLSASAFTIYAAPDEIRTEKRVQRMTKNLQLNEQQQQQMRDIMKTHQKKRQALKDENIAKIKAILTAEQLQNFEKRRAERKAKREARREERKNAAKNQVKPAS